MTATIGYDAELTSWATTGNYLIASGSAPTISVSEVTEDFDATGLADSAGVRAIGLKSATGQFTQRWTASAPQTGYTAYLAWDSDTFYDDGSGNVVGFVGFNLSMSWASLETTAKNAATALEWRTFAPGLLSWEATVDLRLDDTEALLSNLDASDSSLSAIFSLDGTRNYTGEVYVIGQDHAAPGPSQTNTQRWRLGGTGALTAAGSTNFFAAAAVPSPPTPQTLTMTFASGRTKAGSAFLTSCSINAPTNGLIESSVGVQFTGAVTSA